MEWTVIQQAWLPLVLLGVLLVTGVLAVLAAQRHYDIAIHDRIRDSKELRRKYLDALKNNQRH